MKKLLMRICVMRISFLFGNDAGIGYNKWRRRAFA